MTTPDLKALSDAATQGEYRRGRSTFYSGDDDRLTVRIYTDDPSREMEIYGDSCFSDAAYIAALVNAHRAGQLFTAADVDAAVRKENEACAEVCEEKARANPQSEGQYLNAAFSIRARTTQEGET